jgi:hypothetical protein
MEKKLDVLAHFTIPKSNTTESILFIGKLLISDEVHDARARLRVLL